eukprot:4388571-Amphidinium_carterae.1
MKKVRNTKKTQKPNRKRGQRRCRKQRSQPMYWSWQRKGREQTTYGVQNKQNHGKAKSLRTTPSRQRRSSFRHRIKALGPNGQRRVVHSTGKGGSEDKQRRRHEDLENEGDWQRVLQGERDTTTNAKGETQR